LISGMNVLLHICCGPCMIYPLQKLRSSGCRVSGLFYNPNIHPEQEYAKRREAVEALSGAMHLAVEYPEYLPSEFFQAIGDDISAPQRCLRCWRLRLKISACRAKEAGCDAFTSTLLVSPYQDQDSLKQLGNEVGREYGVDFYYEDFRPGFRQAHEEAKKQGIYCQRYCGCSYSEIERNAKVKNEK